MPSGYSQESRSLACGVSRHGWLICAGHLGPVGFTRYPTRGLLERIWALRDNLSACDAGHVALAESLNCPLVTADGRISRAPGIRCLTTVVPR